MRRSTVIDVAREPVHGACRNGPIGRFSRHPKDVAPGIDPTDLRIFAAAPDSIEEDLAAESGATQP
jgi:hypothetical protein